MSPSFRDGRAQTRITIFPKCWPLSMRRKASGACSKAKVESITGLTLAALKVSSISANIARLPT